jgi:hypothetical protein
MKPAIALLPVLLLGCAHTRQAAPKIVEIAADDCVRIAEIHAEYDVKGAKEAEQACTIVRDLAPLLRLFLAQQRQKEKEQRENTANAR